MTPTETKLLETLKNAIECLEIAAGGTGQMPWNS